MHKKSSQLSADERSTATQPAENARCASRLSHPERNRLELLAATRKHPTAQ